MKLAIHQHIRGKPKKHDDGSLWMGNQRINLGDDWVNIDVDWPTAFEVITDMGCATTAELKSTRRNDNEFVSRELLMVDIDSGMTIEELLQDDFYNEYGAGFYTTPSHTDKEHRFRIMFRTQQPIQDSQKIRQLIMSLMRVYDHADVACKDSTRIFYGTVKCVIKECRDNILSQAMIEALLAMEDMFRAEANSARPISTVDPTKYPPKTIDDIAELLDELRKHYSNLENTPRGHVVWAIMSAGISGQDTIALMRQRWPDTDKTEKYENFVRSHKHNAIKLGTVYHMIRQHNPDYKREREFNSEAPTERSIKQLRRLLKEMN